MSNLCSKHCDATIRSIMATLTSETSPLLADATPAVESHDAALNAPATSNDDAFLPASAYFPRTRRILSILILVSSPIIVILIIPARILIVDLGSYSVLHSDLLYYTKSLIFLVCSLSIRIEEPANVSSDDAHVRFRRYQSHMELPCISKYSLRHLLALQDRLVLRFADARPCTAK
jgi:hypothetical protein